MASAPLTGDDRRVTANLALFRQWSEEQPRAGSRHLYFHFNEKPTEILGTARVEAVRLERTVAGPGGGLAGSGQFRTLPVQMVARRRRAAIRR